jgi:hypothetical protein
MAEYNYLEAVKSWPGHQGKAELIRHLEGETLSRAESQKAYCYGCMAGYTDGNKDCELYHCPMYPYQPYGSKKVKSGRAGKTLSPEHLAKMQAGRLK